MKGRKLINNFKVLMLESLDDDIESVTDEGK